MDEFLLTVPTAGVVLLIVALGIFAGIAVTRALNKDMSVDEAKAKREKEIAEEQARRDRASGAAISSSPVIQRITEVASKVLPISNDKRESLMKDLRAAGLTDLSPESFWAIELAGAAVGLALGIMILPSINKQWPGSTDGIRGAAIASLFGIFGFFIPRLLVKSNRMKRQEDIEKGLPSALDLLASVVMAGSTLDSGMDIVGRTMEGPISEEFGYVAADIKLGSSRTAALEAMSERCDVKSLTTFVNAVIQAIENGIAIGSILQEQSRSIRELRQEKLEEEAAKLPNKMMLVSFGFIFPLLLVSIMAPLVPQVMVIMQTTNG